MSRLVHEFSTLVEGPNGTEHTARVRGEEEVENGHWQGWIEFVPADGGAALQTSRETTQSSWEHLRYWASGLSPSYLEMAIRRARRTDSTSPEPPPPLRPPTFDPERIHEEREGAPVARLEIETLDPSLARRVMRADELRAGRVRRVEGGGIVVYDGVDAEEGRPSRHAFLLQYGSENGAAVLANHLWSSLHGEGASLRIDGRPVKIDNHEIYRALADRLVSVIG